jgi:cytochrome c oxidase assembly protein subunit 15
VGRLDAEPQDPKEYGLSSSPTPYNRAHHRFCVLVAGATFLLLVAGALVTSNDAGLSVPDWPTSFGSLYKLPRMVGGVKFEHGHRMVAELIGLLTIILAIWTWRTERRSWVRKLGVAALGTVIAQGILGGITVLFYLPPAVSTAHATLAQTFFCLVVVLTVVTGRDWVTAPSAGTTQQGRPALTTLATLAAASVYVQLILGAGFRHSGIKLLPHLISAVVVTTLVLWTITRVLTSHASVDSLRRPAILLMALLITQLGLGFAAYLTRVQWGQDAVQPALPMVISTVAHVAVGALVLATAVVVAMQSWRHAAKAPQQEAVPLEPLRKVVNA